MVPRIQFPFSEVTVRRSIFNPWLIAESSSYPHHFPVPQIISPCLMVKDVKVSWVGGLIGLITASESPLLELLVKPPSFCWQKLRSVQVQETQAQLQPAPHGSGILGTAGLESWKWSWPTTCNKTYYPDFSHSVAMESGWKCTVYKFYGGFTNQNWGFWICQMTWR